MPVRPYRQGRKKRKKSRRGGEAAAARLRRAAPQTSIAIAGGRIETAALASGRFLKAIIVMRRFRPWQAWQRPTLPSLEAKYHRRKGV